MFKRAEVLNDIKEIIIQVLFHKTRNTSKINTLIALESDGFFTAQAGASSGGVLIDGSPTFLTFLATFPDRSLVVTTAKR